MGGLWDIGSCKVAIEANIARRGHRRPQTSPPPESGLAQINLVARPRLVSPRRTQVIDQSRLSGSRGGCSPAQLAHDSAPLMRVFSFD